MNTPKPPRERLSVRHWLEDRAIGAIIGAARLLPYRQRVRAMGWFSRAVLAPVALNHRTRANLHHVFPDLSAADVRRICRDVADNFGRSLIELHSGAEFARYAATLPITGPGLVALETARAHGQPAILAPIHFGNVAAVTAALAAHGFKAGQVYKPMHNREADRRYVSSIAGIGAPLFALGTGMGDMVRFLRQGGMIALLHDVHIGGAPKLDFLGKPANTALSAAKLALRYDAPLVPAYATRNADGLTFTVVLEEPIAHSDALTMTQALNDSASARIRGTMGQWFWLHRRWKKAPDTRR